MADAEILLIGGGYIGSRIREHFSPRFSVEMAGRDDVDIADWQSVDRLFSERHPRIVINAAAMTATHEIEKPENRTLAYRVNAEGPVNLAVSAQRHGSYLVHLSTGMIFDGAGADGQGFREEDRPNPSCYYAWTKAWADLQIAPFAEAFNALILRLHTPLSPRPHPKNLLNKMCGFGQGLDGQGSMTVIEDFLKAMEKLIKQRATGIYHVVNPGTISFYEIMQELQNAGLIPAEKQLKAVSQAELDVVIDQRGGARQPVSVLNTDKLQAAGIKFPPIRQAVKEAILSLATKEDHAG